MRTIETKLEVNRERLGRKAHAVFVARAKLMGRAITTWTKIGETGRELYCEVAEAMFREGYAKGFRDGAADR